MFMYLYPLKARQNSLKINRAIPFNPRSQTSNRIQKVSLFKGYPSEQALISPFTFTTYPDKPIPLACLNAAVNHIFIAFLALISPELIQSQAILEHRPLIGKNLMRVIADKVITTGTLMLI